MLLSVVAPCFNEEDGLQVFYESVVIAIKESEVEKYEIILVDDGSTDKTWQVIKNLHLMDERVKGIKLSRNFGHQSALTAGLYEALGEAIFIIDADLQDPPALLKEMLHKMGMGFDVVYGQRHVRLGETRFKKASASAFYKILSKFSEIDIPRDTGDFRLINRNVLEAYKSLTESQRFTRGLITWLGFKQIPIVYDRNPRFAGTTNYPLRKMIGLSLDAITGFSLKPLRLITLAGFMLSSFSVFYFFYNFISWLFGVPSSHWINLVTVISFLSGIQLICLGIVGEYVGRTFNESKKRPLYLIQERLEASLQGRASIPSLMSDMNVWERI